MDNKKDFIISAIGAVSVYIILILSFLVYLKKVPVKKIETSSKVTVLQLDVILEDKIKKETIKIQSAVKNTKKSNKVVKKTTSTSIKQKSNLKSLFANVKTTSKVIKKTKILNIKETSIASRFKSKFEKEKKLKSIKVSELVKNKKTIQLNKNLSTTSHHTSNDPYYQKIKNLLSQRWVPTIFQNDLKANVIITIDTKGKFSYKFIQYSGNEEFDRQLTVFLDKESTTIHPVSPSNKTVNIEIKFQSKG